jgi:Protein of unknown function (DUF1326)
VITMSLTKLAGQFLECCDCYTICPCWVNERPDEDHCSAIYVWTFDPGSQIEGLDISGKSVVVAAFHGNRQGTQSAIYVDDTLKEETRQKLIDTFSGRPSRKEEPYTAAGKNPKTGLIQAGRDRPRLSPKGLEGLNRVVGTVIDSGKAKISILPKSGMGGAWEVKVEVDGNILAQAEGSGAQMKNLEGKERAKPLTLHDTALHDELFLDGAVEVQTVDRFEMAVAPLPGAPFIYAGRSGMSARFDYSSGS